MSDDLYWLGFSAFPGVGPTRFSQLLQTFTTAEKAWHADEKELITVLGNNLTAKFLTFKKFFSPEAFQKQLTQHTIWTVFLNDPQYSKLLKELPNAPFVLYGKGDKALVTRSIRTIAVVGSRKITQYGKEVTGLLTKQLVEQDFVIVSGLAIGVDSVAHEAAMEHNGKTIAVLGCGVACCSPSVNQHIYDQIEQKGGAIVAESAFGSASAKGIFPARNRIIAGLSQGVLVTEGAEDSGALITAERAREIHRPIFAVPGPITSMLSKGPLDLLAKGARIVTSGADVLNALAMPMKNGTAKKMQQGATPLEKLIIELLEKESLHFDELVRKTGKDSGSIGSLLSMMEVKGILRRLDGGKFGL